MRKARPGLKFLLISVLAWTVPTQAQPPSSLQHHHLGTQVQESGSMVQIVDHIVAREQQMMQELQKYSPRAETYVQEFTTDRELGPVVSGDHYYVGRMKFNQGLEEATFHPETSFVGSLLGALHNELLPIYGARFKLSSPGILIDENFDRAHYSFVFVRREFLGDVRCLVFDTMPRSHAGSDRFKGRIWVEDQDYNIVRFNGTHDSHSVLGKIRFEAHEDSWRQNLQPGLWLPTYVYSEESGLKVGRRVVRVRGQTWLWGYELSRPNKQEELTKVLVEAPDRVHDMEASHDVSPLENQRRWEKEAEDNIFERLEKAGLVAPSGPVDAVLATVANNLMVTNNLNNFPDLRCRVMLTSPLESFTVGHTIVLSRGLVDVLPDEASLAMILAHEIGHILSGDQANTKYAFNDALSVRDEVVLNTLRLTSDEKSEEAADQKGVELLNHSPYKDKLSNAGLFLKALSAEAKEAPNLLRAQLGNRLIVTNHLMRMADLMNTAPELKPKNLDQIAALPLGSRIKIDAWSGQIDLMKGKPIALIAAREKMPFQVNHFYPYITRKEATAQNMTGGLDLVSQETRNVQN